MGATRSTFKSRQARVNIIDVSNFSLNSLFIPKSDLILFNSPATLGTADRQQVGRRKVVACCLPSHLSRQLSGTQTSAQSLQPLTLRCDDQPPAFKTSFAVASTC